MMTRAAQRRKLAEEFEDRQRAVPEDPYEAMVLAHRDAVAKAFLTSPRHHHVYYRDSIFPEEKEVGAFFGGTSEEQAVQAARAALASHLRTWVERYPSSDGPLVEDASGEVVVVHAGPGSARVRECWKLECEEEDTERRLREDR